VFGPRLASTRNPMPLLPVGVVAEIDRGGPAPEPPAAPAARSVQVASRDPMAPPVSAAGRSVRRLPPVPGPRDANTRQAHVAQNEAAEPSGNDPRADLVPAAPSPPRAQ